MPFPFAPLFLGSVLLVASSAAVPNVDIRKTCQAGASVMAELMAGSTVQHDLEGCLSSEQAARDQIIKDWATYTSTDRVRCVQPTVYLPSYVEWLTCLEMEKEVRSERSASPMTPSPSRASPGRDETH